MHVVALGRRYVLLFRADEAPNFINLDTLAGEVHEHAVLIPSSGLPGVRCQLGHGRLAKPGKAGHSTD